MNKKGVVLFIVLAVILMAVILANVILSLVAGQSRLTHHQVSRIQAQYAAQAGMNLALDRLRTGVYSAGVYGGAPSSCPPSAKCVLSDLTFPSQIKNKEVKIVIYPPQSSDSGGLCYNSPGGSACINIEVEYTYQ